VLDSGRQWEGRHRGEEAARKRQERERDLERQEREREEDEALLESYALAGKVRNVSTWVCLRKPFDRACRRGGLDPNYVRALLDNGADDPYVAAELEPLRRWCQLRGVDWRRR